MKHAIVASCVSLKFFSVDSVGIFGIATRIWCAILINDGGGGSSPHPEITLWKWSPMHRSWNNLLRSKKLMRIMRFYLAVELLFSTFHAKRWLLISFLKDKEIYQKNWKFKKYKIRFQVNCNTSFGVVLIIIWKRLVHFLRLHHAKEVYLRFYASGIMMQLKCIFFVKRYYIALWRRVCNGVTELIDDEMVGMGELAKPFEFSTTNSSPLTFCHPLLACSFAIIRTSRMWVITSPLKRWSLNGVTDTESGLAFTVKFCTISRKARLIRSCYCQSSNTIDGSLNNVANQY